MRLVELVGEKGAEACRSLLRVVVCGEHLVEAVINKEVAVFVNTVAIVVHIDTEAETLVELLEDAVSKWVDTGGVRPNDLLSIEVWYTLTTHKACKDVLMSIYQRVNARLTKLVDQGLDLVKISHVIDASLSLNSLPHHSEAYKVHAP